VLSSLSRSPVSLAVLGKGKLKTRHLNILAGITTIDAEITALLPFLSSGALSLVDLDLLYSSDPQRVIRTPRS